jgi:hypothetical protein
MILPRQEPALSELMTLLGASEYLGVELSPVVPAFMSSFLHGAPEPDVSAKRRALRR